MMTDELDTAPAAEVAPAPAPVAPVAETPPVPAEAPAPVAATSAPVAPGDGFVPHKADDDFHPDNPHPSGLGWLIYSLHKRIAELEAFIEKEIAKI